MVLFLLFILGLAIGSFLNVLIDRIPQGQSPFKGRSYCDNCKKTLKWYDMIPVLSFLILKGKCRYCKVHISTYYPLVELVTGIMFVILFLWLGNLPFTIFHLLPQSGISLRETFPNLTIEQFNNLAINYVYYLFILSSFIVIFFADLKYGIIPDKIVLPAIIISFFFLFFVSKESFQPSTQPSTLGVDYEGTFGMIANKLISALGAFLFFLILYLITRGKGMGFGDVKLAFLLGLFLGFPKIVIALYLAFLTGAIIGSILIIWRKKKLKGGTIPFGPFLIIGAILSLIFGEKILHLVLL